MVREPGSLSRVEMNALAGALDSLPDSKRKRVQIFDRRARRSLKKVLDKADIVRDAWFRLRCSSCLRSQLIGVETVSFLPDGQSNSRDFAGQREPSHLRLHAFAQQSRTEILERPRTTSSVGRRTLEDLFHLMIVIFIQATYLLRFL
jgi:hypothetical protein